MRTNVPEKLLQLSDDIAAHGNGLNGPSRTKIEELVRFMYSLEAREDDHHAHSP